MPTVEADVARVPFDFGEIMSRKPPKRRRKRKSPQKRSARIVTIALYGPDDRVATKLVASVVKESSGKIEALKRWYSPGDTDVRELDEVVEGVADLVAKANPKTVVSPDRIIGCPHEEGIDYPEGESCPECPFWVGKDRFSGESFDEI